MPDQGRKNLPVPADLHRRINIKSAEEGRSMGDLIRQAWELLERAVSQKEKGLTSSSTEVQNQAIAIAPVLKRLDRVRGYLTAAVQALDETTKDLREAPHGIGPPEPEFDFDTVRAANQRITDDVEQVLRDAETVEAPHPLPGKPQTPGKKGRKGNAA